MEAAALQGDPVKTDVPFTDPVEATILEDRRCCCLKVLKAGQQLIHADGLLGVGALVGLRHVGAAY